MKNPKRDENISKNCCRTVINIPNEMDQYFRELATKRGISKTHMVLYAMSWFKDYNESMDLMPKMIDVLKNSNKS